jgi:uncharacterized surface protein with fasciclin (FAS1) repeats
MTESKPNNVMAIFVGIIALVVGAVGGFAIASASDDDSSHDKMEKTSESKMDKETSMDSKEDGVTVGGAVMVRTKDIVDNAVNADNVTTVVAAVKAADLVETLKGTGPFTVFAPNNDAFEALPEGTVDTLLKPENKDQLASILTYHVVSGTYTSADLKAMAEKGETLDTVQGGKLTPVINGNNIEIQDGMGNKVEIDTADVISSNGVTHVIKSVLMSA